jgi:uncharacterized protein (DUF305 family)
MKLAIPVAAVIIGVAVGGAAYAIRGLEPSSAAIAEGKAFTQANNKMMAVMTGNAVVYSGDADRDFVVLMVPHHQGAIDMAAVELKYGTDPTVRALAAGVAAGQQPEIDQMTAWQKTRPATVTPAAATVPAGAEPAAYSAANDAMMNGMMGDSMAHSGNADVDFVKMMIPHHQGAIDMANVELKFGHDPQIQALAHNIVVAQTAEIAQMNAWLKSAGR